MYIFSNFGVLLGLDFAITWPSVFHKVKWLYNCIQVPTDHFDMQQAIVLWTLVDFFIIYGHGTYKTSQVKMTTFPTS